MLLGAQLGRGSSSLAGGGHCLRRVGILLEIYLGHLFGRGGNRPQSAALRKTDGIIKVVMLEIHVAGTVKMEEEFVLDLGSWLSEERKIGVSAQEAARSYQLTRLSS